MFLLHPVGSCNTKNFYRDCRSSPDSRSSRKKKRPPSDTCGGVPIDVIVSFLTPRLDDRVTAGKIVLHASGCPLATRRCTNDTTHPSCRTSFHVSEQPSDCLFAETEAITSTSDVQESPASSDAQQSVVTKVPAAGSSGSDHVNAAVVCKTYLNRRSYVRPINWLINDNSPAGRRKHAELRREIEADPSSAKSASMDEPSLPPSRQSSTTDSVSH